ncbi:MAG: response regulator [Deltaproteobacteria bacterium]|nr:response regulator [Deltaproteobacteria bacterium]MBW2047252.1 response regulator [Deltaproteobacteria bacterium]MBW2095012.1 response regulator [Deltaproteobacteria bacterium]
MIKILIVDDSAFTRAIHRQVIQNEGYQAVEAASGAEALDLFKKEKPDLVMMDLLMPEMDGMDVTKKILEIQPKAKIVICSTDRQKTRQAEAKQVGAVGFLTKPIDKKKMADTLRNILGC